MRLRERLSHVTMLLKWTRVVGLLCTLSGVIAAGPCLAGYHFSRTHDQCQPCIPGVSFTGHANNFDACLPCHDCDSGEEVQRPCIPTHDTVCQCKAGMFKEPGSPESCVPCKTCSDGQRETSACTPRKDRECSDRPVETTKSKITVAVVIVVGAAVVGAAVVGAGIACWVVYCYCKRNKRQGLCKNTVSEEDKLCPEASENPGSNEVNYINPLNHSDHSVGDNGKCALGTAAADPGPDSPAYTPFQYEVIEHPRGRRRRLVPAKDTNAAQCLQSTFDIFIDLVPFDSWRRVMQSLGLTENEITMARMKDPSPREQAYNLLVTWQGKEGLEASINDLLDALDANGQRLAGDRVQETLVKSGAFVYKEEGPTLLRSAERTL